MEVAGSLKTSPGPGSTVHMWGVGNEPIQVSSGSSSGLWRSVRGPGANRLAVEGPRRVGLCCAGLTESLPVFTDVG